MLSLKKISVGISVPLAFAVSSFLTGCSEQPRPSDASLGQEEAQRKQDISQCIASMSRAGAKWSDGRASRTCEEQYVSRPERARSEIMREMGKRGLGPENFYSPELLPDGECKTLANRYIELQTIAYRQNTGSAKDKTIDEANVLMSAVKSGSCSIPTLTTKAERSQ